MRLHRIAIALAFSLIHAASLAAAPPTPIILDTDIGTDVDDAYALVLAARSQEIDLRAVTTVYAKPDVRAAIAKKLLVLGDRDDVPVAAGRPKAIDGHEPFWGGWEGVGILEEGEQVEGVSATPAPDLIAETLSVSHDKLTIVSVGGLSNVAAALQGNPALAERIERFVIMGGCVRPLLIDGKPIPERFETNLHNDVDAARIVFESGVPILLVPAEVTFRTKLLNVDLDRIKAAPDPLARAIAAMTAEWEPRLKGFMNGFGVGDYYRDGAVMLHDPLAVATLVDPKIVVTRRETIRLEIEEGRIKTIADPDGPFTIELVVDADLERLSTLVAKYVLKSRH